MSDPGIEQRPSRRLWILAALVAFALHLGGAALAIAHLRSDDSDNGLGANGAEIAIEMASPKLPDDDRPPGPDTDPQQASPPIPEQKAEVKETELPRDRPTETEDPDRIVTTNDSKKPKEDDPKIAAVQTEAQPEQDAQVATARPTLEENAPEAEKATAPNLGLGKDRQKLTADWGRKISAYFKLHQRYPAGKTKPAKVTLALVFNRLGHVLSVDVQGSSGDPAYDEAAISMIRRSDPVPRPPAGLTDDVFSFSLDLDFKKLK